MVVQTHDITPSQAARAASKQSASPQFTGRVSLTGPDSPGLVHNLTALLRDHGLNITALDSRVFERSRLGRRDTPADETARSLAHRKATDIFDLAAVVTADARPKPTLHADAARLKETFHLDVLDIRFEDDTAVAEEGGKRRAAKR